MLTTTRRWLWVLAGSLAVACSLNPQPDLPGGVNSGMSGNNAGGSGVVTPSAGTGNINLGGSSTGTAGSGTGGSFSQGGTPPTSAGGDASAGDASGGDASGGGGGDGGEAGENALGAGNHG